MRNSFEMVRWLSCFLGWLVADVSQSYGSFLVEKKIDEEANDVWMNGCAEWNKHFCKKKFVWEEKASLDRMDRCILLRIESPAFELISGVKKTWHYIEQRTVIELRLIFVTILSIGTEIEQEYEIRLAFKIVGDL